MDGEANGGGFAYLLRVHLGLLLALVLHVRLDPVDALADGRPLVQALILTRREEEGEGVVELLVDLELLERLGAQEQVHFLRVEDRFVGLRLHHDGGLPEHEATLVRGSCICVLRYGGR